MHLWTLPSPDLQGLNPTAQSKRNVHGVEQKIHSGRGLLHLTLKRPDIMSLEAFCHVIVHDIHTKCQKRSNSLWFYIAGQCKTRLEDLLSFTKKISFATVALQCNNSCSWQFSYLSKSTGKRSNKFLESVRIRIVLLYQRRCDPDQNLNQILWVQLKMYFDLDRF